MYSFATIRTIDFVDGRQILTVVIDNLVKVLMNPSILENNMLLPNDFIKVSCSKDSPSVIHEMVFVDKVF